MRRAGGSRRGEGKGLGSRGAGRRGGGSLSAQHPCGQLGDLPRRCYGRRGGGCAGRMVAARVLGDRKETGGRRRRRQEGKVLSARRDSVCGAWNRVFFNEMADSAGRRDLAVDRKEVCADKKGLLASSERGYLKRTVLEYAGTETFNKTVITGKKGVVSNVKKFR